MSLKTGHNHKGHLTSATESKKDVKQGNILAPLLFNFYINSMVDYKFNANCHPKLAESHISALLYADAAAILSRTHIGLKRALRTRMALQAPKMCV